MQKLQTVNAETLLYEPLEKPSFVVDSLIPTGLSLFCGSQKIGKSWLMLKLCLCVSQGLPLWDMPTMEGDVLYLCLEDTFCRIQDRLFRLTNEASRRLHFAVASCKLSDGLIVQLEDYLKDYPNSRLIVIDTLQKVRTASKDNAYASDYGDISLIKDFLFLQSELIERAEKNPLIFPKEKTRGLNALNFNFLLSFLVFLGFWLCVCSQRSGLCRTSPRLHAQKVRQKRLPVSIPVHYPTAKAGRLSACPP